MRPSPIGRRAIVRSRCAITTRDSAVLPVLAIASRSERTALQFMCCLGVLRDHADAVAGLGVDEIEPDAGPIVARVVKGHGTRDEGEAQVTTPDGSRGH